MCTTCPAAIQELIGTPDIVRIHCFTSLSPMAGGDAFLSVYLLHFRSRWTLQGKWSQGPQHHPVWRLARPFFFLLQIYHRHCPRLSPQKCFRQMVPMHLYVPPNCVVGVFRASFKSPVPPLEEEDEEFDDTKVCLDACKWKITRYSTRFQTQKKMGVEWQT